MHAETNDLMRTRDIQEEFLDHFLRVPSNLAGRAKEILGDKDTAVVTRDTQAGRNLMTWKNNERNRRKKKRQAQRKARQKSR